MKDVPKIGKEYHFFDDGKIRESRHYIATVNKLITPEEAKSVIIDCEFRAYIVSLYDIWKEEIEEHRQTVNFEVINGSSTEPGAPWLYAEDTDYFVECSIPAYDEDPVWFVRDVHGGWFSLNTVNTWMTGELDIDGKLFNSMIKNYEITKA